MAAHRDIGVAQVWTPSSPYLNLGSTVQTDVSQLWTSSQSLLSQHTASHIDTFHEYQLPINGVDNSSSFIDASSVNTCGLGQTSTKPETKFSIKEVILKSHRKMMRNQGKEYKLKSGKLIRSKSPKFINCHCHYSCNMISEDTRRKLHEEYWKTGNWEIQTNFIIQNIKETHVKRRTGSSNLRQNSRSYFLNDKRVCKIAFTSTLDITSSRIAYALKQKKQSDHFTSPDKRGKYPSNKTSQVQQDYIKKFLERFPKYESDYSSSEKLYFHPDLTQSKLYEIYKMEQCGNDSINTVKQRTFRNILKQYNMGFYIPKTNTCELKLKMRETVPIVGLNQPINDVDSSSSFINASSVNTCELGQTSTKPEPTFSLKEVLSKSHRKLMRNQGKEYKLKSGKLIRSKSPKFINCHCHYNCNMISEDTRRKLHEEYWKTGNWEIQTNFILQNIKETEVKRRTCSSNLRQNSRSYFLNDKRVCKIAFTSTLDITSSRIAYALKQKKQSDYLTSPDKRGKYPSNKTPQVQQDYINKFLERFPKYESDYSSSEKLYFHPDLTQSKLYEIYKMEHCENDSINTVKQRTFRNILKQYNMGFYVPKTKTCQLCNSLNLRIKTALQPEVRIQFENERNSHHHRAETAQNCLSTVTKNSKSDISILSFTFNMQKTMALPHLNTSVVYYNRQLLLYNVGINTTKDNQGYICSWLENEGKRGSNEICSSIYEFLLSQDLSNVKTIHTFSDCCSGENRNKNLISFMMWYCDTYNIKEWKHTYLESGHSFLPNDSDFRQIEKKKRRSLHIFNLEEWHEVVRSAQVERPFKIVPMQGKMGKVDLLTKERKFNKIDIDGVKLNWLQIKWHSVEKGSSIMKFKYDNSMETLSRTVYLPLCQTLQMPTNLEPVPDSVKISKEKYEELQTFLKYIPSIHPEFYRNLPH